MKKAIQKLTKVLEEQYTKYEIQTLEWFPDQETKEVYVWKFRFPEDGITRTFTYIKSMKSVVIRTH